MSIIATDLDGTLLTNDNKISDENRKAIQLAQSEGFEVVIATGRAFFDAQAICKRAGISAPIIGTNGATINLKSGERLAACALEKNAVKELIQWLDEQQSYYEVFTEDGIYVQKKKRDTFLAEVERLKQLTSDFNRKAAIADIEKQLDQTGYVFLEGEQELHTIVDKVYNIIVWSLDKANLKNIWIKFNSHQAFSMVSSAEHNCEIVSAGVSKGSALKQLANHLNISLDQAMAIGDSNNDLSMLQIVKHNVAVGNASDEIKKHCMVTTTQHEEHGVARAINRYIENRKVNSSF